MISLIELRNFQSHRNSKLYFHPGVNVIIGTSDSGKTAIVRGLRWLVWGRPLGSGFQSHWGGATSVNLLTTENINIYREKDKTDYYQVDDMEFRAFGTEVPKEVRDALNLNEVNLQRQLDQPFLISESPGEVAQHFNRVANLDQIDISMKNISSLVKSIDQKVKFYQQEKERLEEELKKYDVLDKMEIDLEILEDLDNRIDQQKRAEDQLSGLLKKEKEIRQQIDDFAILLSLENEVSSIVSDLKTKNTALAETEALKEHIKEIKQVQHNISTLDQLIENEKTVKELLLIKSNLDEALFKSSQLTALKRSIRSTQVNINATETKVKELTEKFNTLFPDLCPLCGTPKDKIHAAH